MAIIVAVEYDALYRTNLYYPGDWSWYVRPLQICQWTMMVGVESATQCAVTHEQDPGDTISSNLLDVLEKMTWKTEQRVALAQVVNETYDGFTSSVGHDVVRKMPLDSGLADIGHSLQLQYSGPGPL